MKECTVLASTIAELLMEAKEETLKDPVVFEKLSALLERFEKTKILEKKVIDLIETMSV